MNRRSIDSIKEEGDSNTLRVLIANDDPVQLAILKVIFEKCNFLTYTAQNGMQAYEQITKKTKQLEFMYDLVILDLEMPVCDGYSACQQIKMQFENKNIPAIKKGVEAGVLSDYMPIIVAVSGYIDEKAEKKIAEVEFNGFFQAPLSVEDIKEMIMPDILKRKEALQEIESLD